MKLLILNRRDIKNPFGGGAEYHTHEIAKGLVKKYGCEIEVFTSLFMGGKSEESIDGVRYIRKGNELTVHLWGFFYALRNRNRFSVMLDQFNGLGFFTFIFPNSILWIHQMYKKFWIRELGIAGFIPYLMEPLLLWLYRNRQVIALSDSTREDLSGLGFRRVMIVSTAIDIIPGASIPAKEALPTLIFLGRLRSTKQPQHAIEIFEKVQKELPGARLWMVGRGPDEKKLKKRAEELQGITFHGWVDEDRKFELLRLAHVLLVPSVREGFGINVIEAAAAGTPTIGYNVHGLRDSIRHGRTGFLVSGVEEGARKAVEILKDHHLYTKLAEDCMEYSRDFRWDKRVDEFWDIIKS